MPTFDNLRDLRERLLRFSVATVARETRIDRERLDEVEGGAAPSVYELELLAEAYGVDPELLWDEPIAIPEEDAMVALASLDEFRDLGDMLRVRLVRAARAARDLVKLRALLGDSLPTLPALPPADPSDAPHRQGAALAHALRKRLGLGIGPIDSMRDFFGAHFPQVGVLVSDLGHLGPAGLAFADATRGPSIVLNFRGKNENASVRRFSLAHELCHLFADWNRSEPLATISGYLSETALAREQRANAFAVRLLCPESVVQGLQGSTDDDALRVMMETYKLHYEAARLYLKNEANIHLPREKPSVLPDPRVEDAEKWQAVHAFPLERVPLERRGPLAHAAVRSWCRGVIGRDECAAYLGITPEADLERIADYYDEDFVDASTTENPLAV